MNKSRYFLAFFTFFGGINAQVVFDRNCYHNLYKELTQKTDAHVAYLTSRGLAERAQNIKISWFKYDDPRGERLDLEPFKKCMQIPQEVIDFNQYEKNTLITTDPHVPHNKPEDLQSILDIRLYPALRDFIKEHRVEIFLGTRQEMQAYYEAAGTVLLFEFTIPSSAKYYIAQTREGTFFVVMAGLVSRENIIAQLLTLKFAEVSLNTLQIIGDTEHFKQRVNNDIRNLLQCIPALQQGTHVLVIAGCGLEIKVRDIIMQEFSSDISELNHFNGDIVSLVYLPVTNPLHGIHGFISLHLNYGDIMEEITTQFLERCRCRYVFTGGAGGYIVHDTYAQKPEVGTRLSITRAMNEYGEIVSLENQICILSTQISTMHLQIPSIFLETYGWFDKARQRGNTVDVETFYIMRAIQHFNEAHQNDPVKADCGCFISDYVGEQPLREYSQVYRKYPDVLSRFLRYTTKVC